MSRYHSVSTKDETASNLDVNSGRNRFLSTFSERKEVMYSWRRKQTVGAQVFDTSKATIPVSGDAVGNNAALNETLSLFGHPGAVGILISFMEHSPHVEEGIV